MADVQRDARRTILQPAGLTYEELAERVDELIGEAYELGYADAYDAAHSG